MSKADWQRRSPVVELSPARGGRIAGSATFAPIFQGSPIADANCRTLRKHHVPLPQLGERAAHRSTRAR